MKRCPITYEPIEEDKRYSETALKLLSRNLKELKEFPYTSKEQILLAVQFAQKLSIQGVQPKLSIKLNVKDEKFEVVAKKGQYILKPPHDLYMEVPQNEDVTMRLAKIAGIDVPFHGMIYNADGSLSYIIKRFDRKGTKKIGVEDFSQLLGFDRETKYESSMEQVISVVEKHCSFPALEKLKLFRLVLFNFLVGNEDMHLKNFTLIRQGSKVNLSPAYDLLNTTILIKAKEEIALSICGKKSRLKRGDLLNYFAIERLKLSKEIVEDEMRMFNSILGKWEELLESSFLSEPMRAQYLSLIKERWKRLS